MQKLRVGVLMGGKSIEHEVSFNSGRTVCDHLDIHRYEVIPLYQTQSGGIYLLPWHFLHRGKTSDFIHRLKNEASIIQIDALKDHIDFIYIATHGRFAEDGTLQGMLEILNIPYLGSKVFGSAIGLDKALQRTLLEKNGIEVPNGMVVYAGQVAQLATEMDTIKQEMNRLNLAPPLVVKPHKEGSSLGVTIVFDILDLPNALQKACHADSRKPQDVIIEEKVEGMEFCCIVLSDYKNNRYLPLPITEIVPEPGTHFFDYDQKYMPGRSRKITPARCAPEETKKIQEACIKIMNALEFTNLSRTDGFLTKDGRVLIIDSNTLTGMGPSTFLFHQGAQCGMNHTKLINHLIETELHNYGMLAAIEKQEQEEQKMNPQEKMKVAVLFGGTSNEKEISLESGRNIVYKLSPHKYEVTPLFVNKDWDLYKVNDKQLVHHATIEIEESLQPEQKIEWDNLKEYADFAFIGLHGGKGENGSLQGMLEMMGIPYNGSSVLQSALCMDKYKTSQFLKQHGFNVPIGYLLEKEEWQTKKEIALSTINKLSFPLIAKPHDDGCSVGVQKIKTEHNLEEVVTHWFSQDRTALLLEQCIHGMELTVGVVGNSNPIALVPSQAVTTHDILTIEEKFLPGAGENQTPAPLDQSALMLVQKTIVKAYKALGLKGYARIDCFYQSKDQSTDGADQVIILEVNTLPGMTPATCIFGQAAEMGIKPMEFIDLIVELGMYEWSESHDQKDEPHIATQQIKKQAKQTL